MNLANPNTQLRQTMAAPVPLRPLTKARPTALNAPMIDRGIRQDLVQCVW